MTAVDVPPPVDPPGVGPASPVLRVLAFVRDATFGILRDFVVQVFRDGVIRLKGLRPLVKAVVGVAMALVVVAMGALVTADRWRAHGPLVPQTNGQVGRGTLIPENVLPFTLLLLAVGTALMLAGALRAMRPLRFLVLLVFVSFTLEVRDTGDRFGGGHDWRHWAGWIGIAVVLAVFALAWRCKPRPALELGVLLAATVTVFAVAQSQLVGFDRFAGTSLAADHFNIIVTDVRDLTLPLIFAAGLGVVAFAVTATGWVLEFVDRRVPARGVYALLAIVLAWRLHDLAPEAWHTMSTDPAHRVLGSYAGAVGLLAVVWAVWWVVERASEGRRAADDIVEDDELEVGWTASSAALPIAGILTIVPLLLFVSLFVLEAIGTFSLKLGARMARADLHISNVLANSSFVHVQRVVVCVVGLLAAPVLARRGKRILGLYVGVVAGVLLYQQVTVGWSHFRALQFTPAQVDEGWFVVVLGLAAWWAVRGRLTEQRAERLFFVGLLLALIRQREFVSDPFSLVLGFTGIGFVVFGLVWGFLTAGGWANASSRAFPRSSRVFLYLGYSLFGITLLVYFASSHQVATKHLLTSTQPSNGFDLLGMPLVYSLAAVMLAGAWSDRPLQLSRAEQLREQDIETELVADEVTPPAPPPDRALLVDP
ncbi:MAG: hypothetical protein JWM05_345 [Acidimicrobiales bacterium]|nr:hypothetical protein [Acidimicrobiales bacterium]